MELLKLQTGTQHLPHTNRRRRIGKEEELNYIPRLVNYRML